MNGNSRTNFALVILSIAVIVLFVWASSLRRDVEHTSTQLAQAKDSLAGLKLVLDTLRAQTPGLGEYMSAVQLHTAKLWFAVQASNWLLAKYELDELEETIEAAEALHAVKNSVDISAVLRAVQQTQLPIVGQSIAARNRLKFGAAYNQTLTACNGCHRASGYDFIHIIRPTREPVTNQRWNYAKEQ